MAEFFYTLPAASDTVVTLWPDDGVPLRLPNDHGLKPSSLFDLARVTQVQVVGDWQDTPLDVAVRRIEATEPPANVLSQRQARDATLKRAECARVAELRKLRKATSILADAAWQPAASATVPQTEALFSYALLPTDRADRAWHSRALAAADRCTRCSWGSGPRPKDRSNCCGPTI